MGFKEHLLLVSLAVLASVLGTSAARSAELSIVMSSTRNLGSPERVSGLAALHQGSPAR